MSSDWTQPEFEIVHKMIAEDKLYREIAIELAEKGYDRSPEAVRKFYKRNQDKFFSEDAGEYEAIEPEIADEVEDRYHLAIEKIRELRDKMVKVTSDKFITVGRPVKPDTKVLCLSDLHIPFENPRVIEHLIDLHKDADILVINGDILEMYLVSKWPKRKNILLRHEFEIATEWLKLFSNIFPKVVLTSGNHEARAQSYFAANIDPAVSFLVNDDILSRLVGGYGFEEDGTFVKKYNFDNVYYDGGLLKWYAVIGKTVFVHPMDFSSVPMRTALNWAEYFMGREEFDCLIMSHCFDEETELLTDRGWRSIDTIEETDRPVSLNLESDELEYDTLNSIHHYDNYDELISISNGDLDIRVTPQHGMLVAARYDKTQHWNKVLAEDLLSVDRFDVPASGIERSTPDNSTLTDSQLALLGWLQTEGSIRFVSKKDGGMTIRIAQSDSPDGYVDRIHQLLQDVGMKYDCELKYRANTTEHGQHRNYNAWIFKVGVRETTWMSEFINPDKTFKWEFLTSLSLRQRQLLIEELCKGDGSKCSGDRWRHFYSANETIRDQFQMLAALSGHKTNWSQRTDGTYVVYLGKRKVRTMRKVEKVPYKGRVWCLSVGNGTLVARRKGTMFIAQNTHHMGSYIWRNKLVIEQGCCCVPLDYASQGRSRAKPQTFGGSVIYMDKDGNVDFDQTKAIYYGTGSPVKLEDALRFL